MGEVIDGKYYVNNHVHMVVDYHPMDLEEVRKIYVQRSALCVHAHVASRQRLALPDSDAVFNLFLTALVRVVMALFRT